MGVEVGCVVSDVFIVLTSLSVSWSKGLQSEQSVPGSQKKNVEPSPPSSHSSSSENRQESSQRSAAVAVAMAKSKTKLDVRIISALDRSLHRLMSAEATHNTSNY